jgi:3-oxoacyl-[acyl-carrier-protein] synthase II
MTLEVVVTGVGVLCPIGIGREAFWDALCCGRSGVGLIRSFDGSALPNRLAAEVPDFDPKRYVAHRKQLKVMCRDAQLGVAAAGLACRDARIETGQIDPERFGVVLGADRICSSLDDSEPSYRTCATNGRFDFGRWGNEGMDASFPLNFLKVLPNMTASHVSIAHDARGPNNTMHHAELSSLSAIAEAMCVIQRGAADAMLAGGASSQLNPFDLVRHCAVGNLSNRQDDPAAAMRPFDADRDGQVWGEGAAIFVLESRVHAERRGAAILARVLSTASTCDPSRADDGLGQRRAMQLALRRANVEAGQLGHLNAHGVSTQQDDRIEARAIQKVAPDVPVLAPKSYFGNLGAAGGAVEMAVSVLAAGAGVVPATLNYRRPDPECPIQVICGEPMRSSKSAALLVNRTAAGQAVAVVLAGPN